MRPPRPTTSGSAHGRAASVIGAPPSPAGDGGVADEAARKKLVASSSAV